MKQEQDGQYQFKEKQIKKIVEQNLHTLENFPKNYIFTSKTWNLFFLLHSHSDDDDWQIFAIF